MPPDECRESLEELQTYLDSESSPDIEQAIRDHIARCPPCLDRADFERQLRAIVAAKCRDAAPSGLLDRVIADLRRAPTA